MFMVSAIHRMGCTAGVLHKFQYTKCNATTMHPLNDHFVSIDDCNKNLRIMKLTKFFPFKGPL